MTFTRCGTHNSVSSYFEEEYEDLLDILKVESPLETATFKPGYSIEPTKETKPIKSTKKSTITTTTSTTIITTTSKTSTASDNAESLILLNINHVNLSLDTGTNFLAKLKRMNKTIQA